MARKRQVQAIGLDEAPKHTTYACGGDAESVRTKATPLHPRQTTVFYRETLTQAWEIVHPEDTGTVFTASHFQEA